MSHTQESECSNMSRMCHHALIFCLAHNSSTWLCYCTWSSRKKRFPLQYTKRTNTIENTLQPNVQILSGTDSPWLLFGHTNRGRALTEMFVTSITAESCSLQWSQTLMVAEQSDLSIRQKHAKWLAGSQRCQILDLQQHGILLRPQLVSDLQASHQLWVQVWSGQRTDKGLGFRLQ